MDVARCPCQIMLLQDAGDELLGTIRELALLVAQERLDEHGSGPYDSLGKGGPKDEILLHSEIIGVRVQDSPERSSLLIAARRSLVKGIRLNLFHRRIDGTYTHK